MISASVTKLTPFFWSSEVDFGEVAICYEETVG